MQDNQNDITEMLVKLMDNELNETDKNTVEKMLAQDAALQERYQYLSAAKQAIQQQGLKQQIQAIQNDYLKTRTAETKPASVVKSSSFFKTFMRVAAVFLMAVIGYSVFQYASTTNQSVYSENFTAYQLPVIRGEANIAAIESNYNAGNYQQAIVAFNSKPNKSQEDYFIAAQSYLQTNNAPAAINAFKQVEQLNESSNEKYFVEETDYYLAFAYIKAGDISAAQNQLDKITSNKQHLFYNKAKSISGTKLFILKMKDKK